MWQNGKTKSAHGVVKTNEHTPRVSCRRRFPVYMSPRWVSDMDLEFIGSAQGVPMELQSMIFHARPRPKLTTTVRAFEAQGNRQLFPATWNPSARSFAPAHAVIVPIRRQSRALIVSRRRSRFDCVQNCQHNAENTHRPMHIADWISGINALSSWPYSSSE